MAYRKGEMSRSAIDQKWPHQVMLPSDKCTSYNYTIIEEFCRGLSLCSRGHSIMHNDKWHRVFCFASAEDADTFRDKFGGEKFDPRLRGRGKRWHLLKDA